MNTSIQIHLVMFVQDPVGWFSVSNRVYNGVQYSYQTVWKQQIQIATLQRVTLKMILMGVSLSMFLLILYAPLSLSHVVTEFSKNNCILFFLDETTPVIPGILHARNNNRNQNPGMSFLKTLLPGIVCAHTCV